MAIVDLLITYIDQVTTEVSQETTPDSLDPNKIGDIGTDLANILKDFLPAQNRFNISAGTDFPTGGEDTDLYYRYISGGIQILRNIVGVWTLLATIPFGFLIPDGILVGLRVSVITTTATVTPGAWVIDNVKYSKDTQTEFTLAAKDPSFDRWDLIYADENNDILIETGIATLVPVKPDIPADCILVDYVYVPAVGLPYALGSPPQSSISPEPLEILASMQDVDGIYTLIWNDAKITQFGVYGRFQVEQAGTYQDVPIKVNKSLITNKPISYEFSLSSIDSLIHII